LFEGYDSGEEDYVGQFKHRSVMVLSVFTNLEGVEDKEYRHQND
jgi:hypothetical protein